MEVAVVPFLVVRPRTVCWLNFAQVVLQTMLASIGEAA